MSDDSEVTTSGSEEVHANAVSSVASKLGFSEDVVLDVVNAGLHGFGTTAAEVALGPKLGDTVVVALEDTVELLKNLEHEEVAGKHAEWETILANYFKELALDVAEFFGLKTE